MASYQDFVIRDGRLIGDFEGLYTNFEDPWHQSTPDQVLDTRRQAAVQWANRLSSERGYESSLRVVELGCGFGHLTNAMHKQGHNAVGVDVSRTAIDRARAQYPECEFVEMPLSHPDLLTSLNPDVILMAEITWYVLDDLEAFLSRLRCHARARVRPTYLIHLLAVYATGVQRYGREYFQDLGGILRYFNMDYLEYGEITARRNNEPEAKGTYFVARV